MTTTEHTSARDVTPADVWRQKAIHTITVPSGAVLKIRIPGIAGLLEAGSLPAHLVGLALLDISHPEGAAAGLKEMVDSVIEDDTRDKLLGEVSKLAEYERRLAVAAIVEPHIGYEDAADYPEDDLAMVAQIVQRLRAYDAEGVRIGVAPLDRFATFHREHGLAEADGCDACERVAQRVSTAGVGGV